MLDINWIIDNPKTFDNALKSRGIDGLSVKLINLYDLKNKLISKVQAVRSQRNLMAKEIAIAIRNKDKDKVKELSDKSSILKKEISFLEVEAKRHEDLLQNLLLMIPNVPLSDVPIGIDEVSNKELRCVGNIPKFAFSPRSHFEIGENLGLMDFDIASKLSGSRFVLLRGALARLERALNNFMLDIHTHNHGYTEVSPPVLVRDSAMIGTGQLPKFEDDQFWAVDIDDVVNKLAARVDKQELLKIMKSSRLGLIPTAEVPLVNMVREKILDIEELPLRFTAGTLCFRAEAGAAGRDTRGMIRQHQFSKVELVSIVTQEQENDELERMLSCAEVILKKLNLCYRVIVLSTGDMGFSARKTYDIEVWFPQQQKFREISSCSLCGDFQARRMKAKYRLPKIKKTKFVHTLNGSGIAITRAIAAIIENNQLSEKSIAVPEVLIPYMGGETVIQV